MQIKVKTPAKINLTLEIEGKREDGFHNIKSIMQMINLYDILTFDIEKSEKTEIILSGTNPNIPYDEHNLVYKAIKLFMEKTNMPPHKISVHLEKNIPTEAGLAGGSSNAAGTFLVLNKYFNNVLSKEELHELCAKLGSDLNVCLEGGCILATGRGENVKHLPFKEYPVSLIKPPVGVSAKEAYQKYASIKNKQKYHNTEIITAFIGQDKDISPFLYNDLETAIYGDYEEMHKIKSFNPDAVMTGSGSTYFVLSEKINPVEDFWTAQNLKTIPTGCEIID